MANISWKDAVEVSDAHAAIAAAQAQLENDTILLKTPEGGLFTLGSRYWLAVGTKLIREFPNHDIVIIVDAAEDAGIAMGAIADGHKAVRFTGEEETFKQLEDIGQQQDTQLLR